MKGLFRAKSINNEWVVGMLRYVWSAKIGGFDTKIAEIISETDGRVRTVRCDTVCEFTGMTDCRSVRIFEHDIVTAWSQGSNIRGVVTRRKDGLWIIYPAYQLDKFWRFAPDAAGQDDVEVIGNSIEDK